MDTKTVAKAVGLTNIGLWLWALLSGPDFRPLFVLVTLSFLVQGLKLILQMPRPCGAHGCDDLGKEGPSHSYGMPSGHVATAVAGWLLIAQAFGLRSPLTLVVASVVGTVMAWARVTVGCHTWLQGIAGMLLALVWTSLFTFKS